MKLFRVVAWLLLAMLASTGSAWAGLIDPADLHISSSTSFSQQGGGTDWITLDQFGGNFTIEDVSNNGVVINQWHIVLAIPNVTGAILDSITKIGTTSVNITPGPDVVLTSGSAYDALGISGAPGSVSFDNFVTAATTLGLPAPTSYGLYDFSILGLALIAKSPLDLEITGLLPKGTVIFAYGDDGEKLYTTAFTNAGVVTPQIVNGVPEPATVAGALSGGICLLSYGAWRLREQRARRRLQLLV